MKFEWEEIVDEATCHFTTHRAKVFGGWLVRTNEYWKDDLFGAQSEALVFIHDPKHLWSTSEGKDPTEIDISDFRSGEWGFSVRTVRLLRAQGIETIKELLSWCEHQLKKIPNFGQKSLIEVKDMLSKEGLKLSSYPKIKFPDQDSKCQKCYLKEISHG